MVRQKAEQMKSTQMRLIENPQESRSASKLWLERCMAIKERSFKGQIEQILWV